VRHAPERIGERPGEILGAIHASQCPNHPGKQDYTREHKPALRYAALLRRRAWARPARPPDPVRPPCRAAMPQRRRAHEGIPPARRPVGGGVGAPAMPQGQGAPAEAGGPPRYQ